MCPLPSRNRRRPEKKLTWLPLVLLAVLCLASFFGGVWVGRVSRQVTTVDVPPPQTPAIAVAREVPSGQAKTAADSDELTFFDTLSKGEQSPLGSGINLPPAKEAARPEANPPAPKAPVQQPAVSVAAPKAVPTAVPIAASAGAYLVQAASFGKEEEALALQARLLKNYHPVFVQAAHLGERGTWYRVMIGPLENTSAAEGVVNRLKIEEKLSAMVRKR
jgi:DedD protein